MPWLQSLPTERRPDPNPKTEAQLLVTQDVVHVVVVSQRVAEASLSERRRRRDLIFVFAPRFLDRHWGRRFVLLMVVYLKKHVDKLKDVKSEKR